MGYWVYLEHAQVNIPLERKRLAFATLKRLVGSFTWVNSEEYVEAETFEEALQALRWRPVQDRQGNVFALEFNGQKIGEDYEVFETLAPFVQAGGEIAMCGEDEQKWTWGFDGRHVRLIAGSARLADCILMAIPGLSTSRPPMYPADTFVREQADALIEALRSLDAARQQAAWLRAWSGCFSSRGRTLLRLVAIMLISEYGETEKRIAQWWLNMLLEQQTSEDGDAGDLGLTVALETLSEIAGINSIAQPACIDFARACTQNWAERLFTALRSGNAVRLQHLFLLAEMVSTLPQTWIELAHQVLLKALADPWYELRHTAAEALGRLGKQGPLDALRVMLHSTHWEQREAAVHALGRSGECVPRDVLYLALQDEHPVVREAAILALAWRGDPELDELLTPVLTDPDREVRQTVLRVLSTPKEQLPADFVQALGPLSASERQRIIAQALGEPESGFLTGEAVQTLRHCLLKCITRDNDPHSRMLARRVLGKYLPVEELLEQSDTWQVDVLKVARQIVGSQKQASLPEPIRALLLDDSQWYKHRVVFDILAAFGQGATLEDVEKWVHLSERGLQAHIPLWAPGKQDLRLAGEILEMWGVTAFRVSETPITPLQITEEPVSVNTLRLMERMGKEAPFEVLIAALSHEQPRIRGAALRVMKKLADVAPLELLLARLDSFDRLVRREVIEILGQRLYQPAIPRLLALLRSENVLLRSDAVRGLLLLADFLTMEDLQAVRTPENERDLLRIMVEMGEHEAALHIALGILERRAEHVRSLKNERGIAGDAETEESFAAHDALEALGKLGTRAPLEPLLAALEDPDNWIRSGAVQALAKMGSRVSVEVLFPLLEDPDQYMREHVANTLKTLGDPRAISTLIAALADPIYEVREVVISALKSMVSSIELDKLLPVLEHRSSSARQAALDVLAAFGERIPVEPVLQAFADSSVWVRCAAVAALGNAGERAPIEPFLQTLRDPSAFLRATTAFALGKMGARTPILPLLAALGDRHAYVRQQALRALLLWHREALRDVLFEAEALLRGEEAGPILGSLAQSQKARVLGDIGQVTPTSLQHLTQALRWPYWQVRFEAVRALARLEGDLPGEVLDLLLELRHDGESLAVREAAEQAVMTILSREPENPWVR